MDNCYFCGKQFNSCDVLKHDEHIIQQAIGGTLTDNSILCSACGEYLGNSVDVNFNKIFDSISTRLDIKKDRQGNKKRSARGVIVGKPDKYGNDLSGMGVFWKDFKVTPITPTHRYFCDNTLVVIYASKSQTKKYIKKVKKELDERFNNNPPKIILCDDIEGLVEYPLAMNNPALRLGLSKIAIGFASKNGVERKDLPFVLDAEKNRLKENVPIYPFYPLSVLDHKIEEIKSEMRNFPAHTLIIFTASANSNVLVCYIELFSTFQWYVVLNENYTGGPMYEHFCQNLSKVSNYVFEPGRHHYKDRIYILPELGISQERIDKIYSNQKESDDKKSIEEIEFKIIQEEIIKKKYEVVFETEVKIAVDHASNLLSKKIIENDKGSLDKLIDVTKNVNLFYDLYEDDEVFNVLSYRRCYVGNNKLYDYIDVINRFSKTDEGRQCFKEYGHAKVNMLSRYIEYKGINSKLEEA